MNDDQSIRIVEHMQTVLIHLQNENLVQYYAIGVEQERPTLKFNILEEDITDLTLKQLKDHIAVNHLVQEYFREPEQIFKVIICCLQGLKYLNDKKQYHGDISPSSITIRGKLLDFLHINELVNIAQGKQVMIYTPPSEIKSNMQRDDIWALGVCFFEMIVSVERGIDGHQFIQKLGLQMLSQSARAQTIAESVKCIGSRAVIQTMLVDQRPTARELLEDPLIQTLQSLIDQQTPQKPSVDGLVASLGFANKNKALIGFLCLLKRTDLNILTQLTQEQKKEIMIRFIELLVICFAQSTEFDQLCIKGVNWIINNSINLPLNDFKLAGGAPLIILVCKRDLDLAERLLQKFQSKTLHHIANLSGLNFRKTPVNFNVEGQELMKLLCQSNTLMSCNQYSVCVSQSMLAKYTEFAYEWGQYCQTCDKMVCHVCSQAHEDHVINLVGTRPNFKCQEQRNFEPLVTPQTISSKMLAQFNYQGSSHLVKSAFNQLEYSIDDRFSLETQNLICTTSAEEFYLEIKVICGGYYDQIAIGLTSKCEELDQFVGYAQGSIGWHGDTGAMYKDGSIARYVPPFQTGDCVGVGVCQQKLFLTLNGVFLIEQNVQKLKYQPVVSLRGTLATVEIKLQPTIRLIDNISSHSLCVDQETLDKLSAKQISDLKKSQDVMTKELIRALYPVQNLNRTASHKMLRPQSSIAQVIQRKSPVLKRVQTKSKLAMTYTQTQQDFKPIPLSPSLYLKKPLVKQNMQQVQIKNQTVKHHEQNKSNCNLF